MITINFSIAGAYVSLKVKDSGTGFDYSAALKKAETEPDAQAESGRGIMLVKRLALRLEYSAGGCEVEAIIAKAGLHAQNIVGNVPTDAIFMAEIPVLRLAGNLDMYSVINLKRDAQRLIDAGCDRLVIDLASVQYIDSSGIGGLVSLNRAFDRASGGLALANPGRQVLNVIRLSKLDSLFPHFFSVDEALQYLRE